MTRALLAFLLSTAFALSACGSHNAAQNNIMQSNGVTYSGAVPPQTGNGSEATVNQGNGVDVTQMNSANEAPPSDTNRQ